MAPTNADLELVLPLPSGPKTEKNRTDRGKALAEAIRSAAKRAKAKRKKLVVDLENFDLVRSCDRPIHALIEVDSLLDRNLKLIHLPPPLWKTLRRIGIPNRLLGKEPRAAAPKAPTTIQVKSKPTARRTMKVVALWAVADRTEDQALLEFLRARKVKTPKVGLAYRRQVFAADVDLVWHLFSAELPLRIASISKGGKLKLENHVAEPESGVDEYGQEFEDNGGKFNQWDFIKPHVEGRPILVLSDEVYVGFNALVAQALEVPAGS